MTVLTPKSGWYGQVLLLLKDWQDPATTPVSSFLKYMELISDLTPNPAARWFHLKGLATTSRRLPLLLISISAATNWEWTNICKQGHVSETHQRREPLMLQQYAKTVWLLGVDCDAYQVLGNWFCENEYLDISRYSYCWRVRGWTVDIYRPICSRVHLSRFNMPSSFSGCPPHTLTPPLSPRQGTLTPHPSQAPLYATSRPSPHPHVHR